MHHITPRASGGANDFENAIALCFDCHSDAGHYNSIHPRGTRFSQSELRRQRDAWYEIVKNGRVTPAPQSPLHVRYLVCKSYELIREIASGDAHKLPLAQPHVAKSPTGEFLQRVMTLHAADHRNDQEWGDHFASVEDYLKAHPDVAAQERPSVNQFPYFEALRVPSRDELARRIAPSDGVTRLLLEADVPAEDVAYALAYNELCGDDRFQEIYRLRPLWAVYLAITNAGEVPVTLNSLLHDVDAPRGLGYRRFYARQKQGTAVYPLPQAGIAPGASAVIPIAALLGPFEPDRFESVWTESNRLQGGQAQELAHGDLSEAGRTTSIIGPALWPLAIRLTVDGAQVEHEVHSLDFGNVYTLSRYWECGSCPHLFLETAVQGLSYRGELFSRAPGVMQQHEFTVPDCVVAFVVAELEDETTFVERVEINGQCTHRWITLTKGDVLRIKVRSGDQCTLSGYYESRRDHTTAPWRRNVLIDAFRQSAV